MLLTVPWARPVIFTKGVLTSVAAGGFGALVKFVN